MIVELKNILLEHQHWHDSQELVCEILGFDCLTKTKGNRRHFVQSCYGLILAGVMEKFCLKLYTWSLLFLS